jgi:hypothetical protein
LKRACNLFKGFGLGGGWMVCRNRKTAFLFGGDMEKKRQVLVRLDEATFQSLRELSFYTDTPMKDIVIKALKDWNLTKKAADAKKRYEDHDEIRES